MNIGSSMVLSISDLATAIREVTGFQGNLGYDSSKPDRMPVKTLDSTTLFSLGWEPSIVFKIAAKDTYGRFKSNGNNRSQEKIETRRPFH